MVVLALEGLEHPGVGERVEPRDDRVGPLALELEGEVAVVGLGRVDLVGALLVDAVLVQRRKQGGLHRLDEGRVEDHHTRGVDAELLGVTAHGGAVGHQIVDHRPRQRRLELGGHPEPADHGHALLGEELRLCLKRP